MLVYVEYAIVKFANMNKLVQDKTKLYFQDIPQHKMFRAVLREVSFIATGGGGGGGAPGIGNAYQENICSALSCF